MQCEHFLHSTMQPLGLESHSESVSESKFGNVIKPEYNDREAEVLLCLVPTCHFRPGGGVDG